MEDLITPIFAAAGRPYNETKRQRYPRMVQKLLSSGLFKIELCDLGKHWTRTAASGKRYPYNIKISMPAIKMAYRHFEREEIRCIDLMIGIGKLLETPQARAIVTS